MPKQNKEVVIKNKLLVNISGNNSFVQRKLFNVFLYKVFNDLGKMDKPFFSIKIKDIRELMGYKNNISNTEFRSDCNGLMRTIISWGVLGDDQSIGDWEDSSLLSSVRHSQGCVEIEIPMMLRLKLVENGQYIKLNLAIQKKFTSKYSLIIYELCKEFYREKEEVGETRWIDLIDLKKFLGLPENDNKEFKTFKRDILNLAIDEINKFSDILITLDFQKEFRKITAIKFIITKNPLYSHTKPETLELAKTKLQNADDKLLQEIEISKNSNPEITQITQNNPIEILKQQLLKIGLNVSEIGKLIDSYSEAKIQEAIELFETTIENKTKIRNPKLWIFACLKNDFDTTVVVQKKKKIKEAKLIIEVEEKEKDIKKSEDELKIKESLQKKQKVDEWIANNIEEYVEIRQDYITALQEKGGVMWQQLVKMANKQDKTFAKIITEYPIYSSQLRNSIWEQFCAKK